MGEEADYLESQSDDGAYEHIYWADIESTRKLREEKRAFKLAVKSEVAKELKRHGVELKKNKPRGKMLERTCHCGCGVKFKAREADVKRGWGKFSSKSCAAKFKDRITNGAYRDRYGS